MQSDEDAIRALVATWLAASKARDVDAVLELVTEEAVFLVPGRPPMRKPEFGAAARAQAADPAVAIDGESDIQEVQVLGDWAFMWSRLRVLARPRDDSPPMEREGHTLTIFRRENGRWRLARDANLLGVARPVA